MLRHNNTQCSIIVPEAIQHIRVAPQNVQRQRRVASTFPTRLIFGRVLYAFLLLNQPQPVYQKEKKKKMN